LFDKNDGFIKKVVTKDGGGPVAWKHLKTRLDRQSWQAALFSCLLWVSGCTSPYSTREEPLLAQPKPAAALKPLFEAASADYKTAAKKAGDSPIIQVRHEETAPPPKALPSSEEPFCDRLPIDLPTALRLAGANHLQIAVAAERVRQAQARLEGAKALWLPTLDAGVDYNRHEGQIQDTSGSVIDVTRSSLFVGGGPKLGTDSLNGGNNGPSRLSLGVPLADALFAPLVERQTIRATAAAQAATFNDSLLEVAVTYLDLLRAQGRVTVAREAVKNAEKLAQLEEARVAAGTDPPADELRARAELADRRRQVFQAQEAAQDASAELVRLLRLQPGVSLLPLEAQPVPVSLVDTESRLPDLIAQGLTSRPELAAHQALVQAALERLRQEQWRPFIPNLQVGLSAGGFGGGPNSFFGNVGGRTDFDALVVWELKGLGFGNRALQRERASQQVQAALTAEQIRDTVAAEIVRAYYQVRLRQQQIEEARAQVEATAEALPLNFQGILGGRLRAIEAQQAIQALAAARDQYIATVIDYNRAQFQLLRALGRPPEATAHGP
jgi:outer membrane protein TolC